MNSWWVLRLPYERVLAEEDVASVHDLSKVDFDKFKLFLETDLKLSPRTVKDKLRILRKFIASTPTITVDSIRQYLSRYNGKENGTYNNQLKALKTLTKFLGRKDLTETFTFAVEYEKPYKRLSKADLQRFYNALKSLDTRTRFLMYASSGLRPVELLGLTEKDTDMENRMIIPSVHKGATKRSWISFFNTETEALMKEYILTRKGKEKLFPRESHRMVNEWENAQKETGLNITAKVLRRWFSDEMGRIGIPDRYVDAMMGHIPRKMLSQRYTDLSPENLKEIYDKANLWVLE